jgi:hypothetical protein
MRGLNRHSSARILTAGHAFVQDLRRVPEHQQLSGLRPVAAEHQDSHAE